jgi:ribosomal protein L11 methyltransferase
MSQFEAFLLFDLFSGTLLQWCESTINQAMSYYEFTITVADAFRYSLIRRLTENGCLGIVENDGSFTAYFPSSLDLDVIRNDLALLQTLLEKAGHAHELTYEYSLIPEKDWNETWKKGFQPVDAGNQFTILPPWEKGKKDRINLVIDPGMAFGTGHHETTRSCFVLIENYAPKTSYESFLDLGTGTGILAIAARKLGYRHVVGIDTDILAIQAARENVIINNVPDVEIKEEGFADLHETFDAIAANLISGVLVLLAPVLHAHMNPGGFAILSGILAGQEGEVIAAMEQTGLRLRETYRDGKWVSLVMKQDRKA